MRDKIASKRIWIIFTDVRHISLILQIFYSLSDRIVNWHFHGTTTIWPIIERSSAMGSGDASVTICTSGRVILRSMNATSPTVLTQLVFHGNISRCRNMSETWVTALMHFRLNLLRGWIQVRVFIFLWQAQILLDCPVAELVKQDYSATVLITISPGSLRVWYFNTPSLHNRNGEIKFFVSDLAVTIKVDLIKSNPVLIVLTKILEQPFVFALLDKIITTLFRLTLVLRCVICSNHDWLCVEQNWKFELVPHTLIKLSQRYQIITINVKRTPLSLSGELFSIRVSIRQFHF